jgi:DNA modification methylase
MKKRPARLTVARALREAGNGWANVPQNAAFSASDYKLFCGDARDVCQSLPSSFVNTCVTSPPYWRARDYALKNQIGQEESIEEFTEAIVSVFKEIKRVLRSDGTAWLNLGDTYLNGVGTELGRPPTHGWKRNKQLSLVPFRVALALEDDGWWVRNAVVWHKINAMPESVDDRLSSAWEPVFLLAKSEHYYFDLDAIRLPHKTNDAVERRRAERGEPNGKAKGQTELRKFLTSPRHRATIDGLKEVRRRPNAPESTELAAFLVHHMKRQGRDIHWVAAQLGEPYERTRHYFRLDKIGSRLPPEETWPKLKTLLKLPNDYDEAMQVEIADNVFRNHPLGRNPGDVLQMPTARGDADHFALMPIGLAGWCLRSTLPPGGIAIDPFMGWGTTGEATLNMGGRFIGVDIDQRLLAGFTRRRAKAVQSSPLPPDKDEWSAGASV